jgi:glucose dehydrogenase
MSKTMVLIGELVLVVAGVFVFRGLWMLLDSVAFMHAPLALWLSSAAGMAATVWALWCIQKHGGG